MPEQRSIFRKVSLDRLSSPEQLDQKLTIVSPIGWVAIMSLVILILAAIAWGIFGIVSNKVHGNGVLMYSDGIAKITSHTSGRIVDVRVQAGDYVEGGDIIALVEQEDLARQIDKAQENIDALETINVETLDLDVGSLNHDLYSAFAQLAERVRTARVQHETQRAEAEVNEQDVANRKSLQAQRVRLLESQISELERQISDHIELLNYQRVVELENADILDKQQNIQQTQLVLAISQLENDFVMAKQNLEDRQTLYDAGVIPRHEIDTLQEQVAKIETDIEARRLDLTVANARRLEQLQNRPNFDAPLASMQSQLVSLQSELTRAQTEEHHLNVAFTDYIWGAYNQTGVEISSIADQFVRQQQILRQDYLKDLEELQKQYIDKSVIKAEFSGVLSGLTIQLYDFVQPGSVLGNIVRGGLAAGSSNVLLYVPLNKGKLVETGMGVNISPATVNREEHGYIIGQVVSVSASSVTHEHMMSLLQNQQLVQDFGGQTAVLEVEVELLRDDSTVSGYQWSTPRGAPFAINPGTVCLGEIKISDQRPIDMIVPFIRRLFS